MTGTGPYQAHRERPFAILIQRLFTAFWLRYIEPTSVGLLPKEYNKNVHGPFVPYRYYGKPDTAFKDVKLGELSAWIRRRNKSPTAIAQACGRAVHYYGHQFISVRYMSLVPLFQLSVATSAIFYILRYNKLFSIHTKNRYH